VPCGAKLREQAAPDEASRTRDQDPHPAQASARASGFRGGARAATS
jgi:hypothetical protein